MSTKSQDLNSVDEQLKGLSYEQLRSLSSKTASLIEVRKADASKQAYEQFNSIASSIGMSVEDIINENSVHKVGSVKKKAEPKYINENGDTWTGRGKLPKWLVAELQKGKNREDFLIKKIKEDDDNTVSNIKS